MPASGCPLEGRVQCSGRRAGQEVETCNHQQRLIIGTMLVNEVVQQECRPVVLNPGDNGIT